MVPINCKKFYHLKYLCFEKLLQFLTFNLIDDHDSIKIDHIFILALILAVKFILRNVIKTKKKIISCSLIPQKTLFEGFFFQKIK